ncbi:hypothetical protein V8F20_011364 [Naviculisporaceae sp. PSN 640]
MSADPAPLSSGRPIRPLPKRRLRERLSPEVAQSIQYPPAPQSTLPLFPYPYTLREEEHDPNLSSARNGGSEADHRPARRNGLRANEDGDVSQRGHGSRYSPPSARVSRQQAKASTGASSHAQPALSSASSLDGYDQIDGTNNKKKRKIPTAGDSASNGALGLTDNGTANSTVDQSVEANRDASLPSTAAAYGTGSFGSSGQNIAGAGRGRYGRSRGARSPLQTLPDSTNNRNGKARPFAWTAGTSESTGIISDAIALAEKLREPQGQENISFFQQHLSNKRGPTSAQFTFECTSKVPGSFAWPGADRRMLPPPGHKFGSDRHSGDNWGHGPQAQPTGQAPAMPTHAESASKEASSQGRVPSPASASKPTRRSLSRELDAQAKARRRETEAKNRRNPPKSEDFWECEFCEYERIFGEPPALLIRQYELKERKQRQLEQRRKAQLERLKKGKHKGKKSSKLPTKNNDAVHDAHPAADSHGGAMSSHHSPGTQSDEFYEDEEEYGPDEEYPDIPPLEPLPPSFGDGGGT